ncbi:MAG: hypothetical protein LBU79_00670 [Planctomycetota bacterium]|nr:hypothetical protein [Planctomycetota bacterium]
MSVQIDGVGAGLIGRMFARQNMQDLYARQKVIADTENESNTLAVDRVDLSPLAPQPLSARLVEEAVETADKLAGEGDLSTGETKALSENRVFAVVSALMALRVDPETQLLGWPSLIPVPTPEELQAARRRLAQKMTELDTVEDSQAVQQERMTALDSTRNLDFRELSLTLTAAE